MGRRAAREALRAAMAYSRTGAGGGTAQGPLADAATELDAAMLLVQQAALRTPMRSPRRRWRSWRLPRRRSARSRGATQIVGAESFRRYILEQLTQDVRALELFAGARSAARSGRGRSVTEGLTAHGSGSRLRRGQ
jgi:hypothetical protein